jgi:hypothetical protein
MLCREPYDPTEALHARARRTAAYMLKPRARLCASADAIGDSLSGARRSRAGCLDRRRGYLLENERKNPRRWFGLGGEIGALNAKAALLLGRTLRRHRPRPEV